MSIRTSLLLSFGLILLVFALGVGFNNIHVGRRIQQQFLTTFIGQTAATFEPFPGFGMSTCQSPRAPHARPERVQHEVRGDVGVAGLEPGGERREEILEFVRGP